MIWGEPSDMNKSNVLSGSPPNRCCFFAVWQKKSNEIRMDIKVYLKYSKIQWLMIDTTIFPCLTAINWGSKGSKPRTDRQTHLFLFIRSASEEGDELMNAQISRTVNGQVRCTAQMDWAPGEFMIEWVHFLHASSKKTFLCFGTSVFLEVHTWYIWENSVFHFKFLERVTTQVDDCRFWDDPLTDWWSSWGGILRMALCKWWLHWHVG